MARPLKSKILALLLTALLFIEPASFALSVFLVQNTESQQKALTAQETISAEKIAPSNVLLGGEFALSMRAIPAPRRMGPVTAEQELLSHPPQEIALVRGDSFYIEIWIDESPGIHHLYLLTQFDSSYIEINTTIPRPAGVITAPSMIEEWILGLNSGWVTPASDSTLHPTLPDTTVPLVMQQAAGDNVPFHYRFASIQFKVRDNAPYGTTRIGFHPDTYVSHAVDGVGQTIENPTLLPAEIHLMGAPAVVQFDMNIDYPGVYNPNAMLIPRGALIGSDGRSLPHTDISPSFIFLGWYADAEVRIDGTTHPIGTRLTSAQAANAAVQDPVTFTAEWEPFYSTVTFDFAGGTFHGEPKVTIANIAYSATVFAPNPTREDYLLIGWQIDGVGAVLERNAVAAMPITTDMTFVAVWFFVHISYPVIQFVVAEKGWIVGHTRVPLGDAIGSSNVPADPEIAGYNFVGWRRYGTTELLHAAEVAALIVDGWKTFVAVLEPAETIIFRASSVETDIAFFAGLMSPSFTHGWEGTVPVGYEIPEAAWPTEALTRHIFLVDPNVSVLRFAAWQVVAWHVGSPDSGIRLAVDPTTREVILDDFIIEADMLTDDGVLVLYAEWLHFVFGDVNRDGLVNAADVSLLGSVAAGNPEVYCRWSADVNVDGLVNAADLSVVGSAAAGNDVRLGPPEHMLMP